ncbi:MAG: hypothetical protein U0559_05190 [Anaerolineae bacterium]
MLGLLQYLMLRFRVERASWWILVNLLAWTIGITLYAILTPDRWYLADRVYGERLDRRGLTGAVLVWLLRCPVIELPAETPLKDDYQS